MKNTIRQIMYVLLYVLPVIGYFAYLAIGTGCGGALIVPEEELPPADPRFHGEYVSRLEGDECSLWSGYTCETTVGVAYVAERVEEDGVVTYHSGAITLYARQTGDLNYQGWDMLLFEGAVQERGRATGYLRVLDESTSSSMEEYPASVILEGEAICPETIRISTEMGEYALSAQRITPCRDDG